MEDRVPDLDQALHNLSDKRHLRRDRALLFLRKLAPTLPDSSLPYLESSLTALLAAAAAADDNDVDDDTAESSWEARAGALLAARDLVAHPDLAQRLSRALRESALAAALRNVAHREVRVRNAAGELLGNLAGVVEDKGVFWEDVAGGVLIPLAEENFALEDSERAAAKLAPPTHANAEAGDMLHDAEGWRTLETSLLALHHILDHTVGAHLLRDSPDDPTLHHVIDLAARRAPHHPNRFVREAALRLTTTLLTSARDFPADGGLQLSHLATDAGLADAIALGLQDNWSQVRFAASVAVRALFLRLCESTDDPPPATSPAAQPAPPNGAPADHAARTRAALYPLLLPRMLLNRHYVAEGVRLYSQETWKGAMAVAGRPALLAALPELVEYLVAQCAADNHAVREAACQAMAEVATRLERAEVGRFVPRMMAALVDGFKDESWPVRDHACSACAELAVAFPDALGGGGDGGVMREVFGLWVAHLADNIPSVRENSARAVVRATMAFPEGDPVCGIERLAAQCRAMLPRVRDQPRDSKRFGNLSDGTQYGVAHKLARDNDPDLHTDQTMYSCGSLAPKLRRGGGCMDHGFSREKEPWEETDGALRLWKHMLVVCMDDEGRYREGAVVRSHSLAVHMVSQVAAIAGSLSEAQFAHTPQLLETFWNQWAAAAPRLGVDEVNIAWSELEPLLRLSKTCGHPLAEAAAERADLAIRGRLGV